MLLARKRMNAKFLCIEYLALEYVVCIGFDWDLSQATSVVLVTALVMTLYKGCTGKKFA